MNHFHGATIHEQMPYNEEVTGKELQVHGDNVMWNCLEIEMKVEDIWLVLKYNVFFFFCNKLNDSVDYNTLHLVIIAS